jgi:multimeric flavodoxin WrbA
LIALDIVVLNGARANDTKVDEANDILKSALETFGQVSAFRLRDEAIADCLGCFGCWIKTPGQCVIDDSARLIANKMAQSDLVVYVTPVVFGGYSSELKKVLDRQICAILPFFTEVKGEFHHPPRYEKIGKLAAIGVLPEPNPASEEIFKKLLFRNSLNKQAPKYTTAIIYSSDNPETIREKINRMLAELEVKKIE